MVQNWLRKTQQHTLRKQRGLSLRQLGDMLGVSDSYVGRMEKGKKIPNVAMVIKISHLFDVTTDQLVKDELVVLQVQVSQGQPRVDWLAVLQVLAPHP